jgi:hypothetical protein
MVGRLLTRGKHLHGRIISLRREISAHIASFNPTTFCWSDSINQGSERSFICMPGVLSLSGHSFVCQECWVWAVIHLYAWGVEFERSFICMPGMLSLSGHSFVCQGCWVWAVIHLYARGVEFERSFICMPGVLSLSGHSFVCQGCWVWAVIHLYARSVEFACFDDFVFGVWNCYDIVVILVFHFIIENEGFSPFFIPETRREH